MTTDRLARLTTPKINKQHKWQTTPDNTINTLTNQRQQTAHTARDRHKTLRTRHSMPCRKKHNTQDTQQTASNQGQRTKTAEHRRSNKHQLVTTVAAATRATRTTATTTTTTIYTVITTSTATTTKITNTNTTTTTAVAPNHMNNNNNYYYYYYCYYYYYFFYYYYYYYYDHHPHLAPPPLRPLALLWLNYVTMVDVLYHREARTSQLRMLLSCMLVILDAGSLFVREDDGHTTMAICALSPVLLSR